MKILQSNSSQKYSCEFGDFKMQPNKGYKITDAFIDHQSQLLIVETAKKKTKQSTPKIKKYIIDPQKKSILDTNHWTAYFSYETVTTLSNDQKYKLITIRVHDPIENNDFIHEKLIETATEKVIFTSKKIAFHREKRSNLLDDLKKRTVNKEEKLTVDQYLAAEKEKLSNGDILLTYSHESFLFELKYFSPEFILSKSEKEYQEIPVLTEVRFKIIKRFSGITSFADYFFDSPNWTKSLPIFKNNDLLIKAVILFANKQRFLHNSSNYEQLHTWEKFFCSSNIKHDEYKQYCINCQMAIRYNPRYPDRLCNICCSQKITDENGQELLFSNSHVGGGLKVVYKKNGKIVKEDTKQVKKICYIQGKKCVATETKFGGIVIQKMGMPSLGLPGKTTS